MMMTSSPITSTVCNIHASKCQSPGNTKATGGR